MNNLESINSPCGTARKPLLQSALAAMFAVAAFVPVASMAETTDPGHWYNTQGIVWKNSTGLCWRSSSWTPANATAECDPELMPKVEAPMPKMAQAAPAPAPMPAPVMQRRKVTFAAEDLFDFDKAELRPAGKASLDKLVDELNGVDYGTIAVTGHTDRLGTPKYNQKLSEQRAASVRSYLVGKGIPDGRMTSVGKGEMEPVTKAGDCKNSLGRKKLITCLQADRRVEVEVNGSREVAVSQ
jgi:OmpA-OmpF porin, OOP family